MLFNDVLSIIYIPMYISTLVIFHNGFKKNEVFFPLHFIYKDIRLRNNK